MFSKVQLTTATAIASWRFSAFLAISGYAVTGSCPSESNSCWYPSQNAEIGHALHEGFFGLHTVAPNSIIAWLKSPGRFLLFASSFFSSSSSSFSSSFPINSQATRFIASTVFFSFTGSPRIRLTRVKTLFTFPSIAASRIPNAIDPTALAVYGPIPGIFNKPITSLGNLPLNSSLTYFAPFNKNWLLL